MNSKNRPALSELVLRTAEGSLARQQSVSPLDVLSGDRWLDPNSLARWRRGRVDYLSRVLQATIARTSEAMTPFGNWAAQKGVQLCKKRHVSKSTDRGELRYSISGDADVERL
jgi:hypothetical protein